MSRKWAAARELDQLEEVNDAVARNLADVSAEELARLHSTHSSPQVKIITSKRSSSTLEVMTAQQRATQERAEELQAEVQVLQKQLRSCQVLPERGWFSEAELHRPDRCSTQSYYFGIPGTWAGLVAVIAALFPKVKELHSPDRRSSPMTSFEECLTWGGRFTSWRTRYERVSPPMIHGRRCRIPVVNHNSFSNFIVK